MSDAQIAAWGRLGQDPKAIDTSSGKPMTVASLAVDTSSGDREDTLWLGIVAFSANADALAKHAKGDCVSVAGRLQRRVWTDRDGKERQDLQVVADTLISARTVRPGGGRKTREKKPGRAADPAPFDEPMTF